MKKVLIKLLSLLSVLALVAAACGGDDDDSSSGSSSGSSSDQVTVLAVVVALKLVLGDLATCPDPLLIQTDWFPESEHGAMYELFGSGDYSIDAKELDCVRYVA